MKLGLTYTTVFSLIILISKGNAIVTLDLINYYVGITVGENKPNISYRLFHVFLLDKEPERIYPLGTKHLNYLTY